MTPRNVVMIATGFFLTGVGSLLLLAFIGFSLGIQVGFSLGCILLAAIGITGILRTRHKYFFAGWLSWTCILAIGLIIVLFL